MNDDCDINRYNDDIGEKMWQEDDCDPNETTHQDWDDDHIGNKGTPGDGACMRDLEDFARLHIKVDPVVANMDGVTYWLRFENIANGLLYVNVFEAVDETTDYVSKIDTATLQSQEENLTPEHVYNVDVQLDAKHIKKNGEVSPFLIEGCNAGAGDLAFIVKKDGREICKGAVRLELHRMEYFYDIYSVSAVGEALGVQVNAAAAHSQTAGYQPKSNEKFLFVHGWNMEGWEKKRWAETAFKRLWWQGYQGSVALFDWPTLHSFDFFSVTGDHSLHHFDDSEFRAWLSADALLGVIDMLNADENLRIMAHSMGNVVMGEALRKFDPHIPPLHTYIACKAALSSQYYDSTVAVNHPCRHQECDLTYPSTPDILGHYHSATSYSDPYMANNCTHVRNMQNFYNAQDWALNLWNYNTLFKPDNGFGYFFGYTGESDIYLENSSRFWRGFDREQTLHVTGERERYMIFAYDVESRSLALGQAENGKFAGWDLETGMGYDNQHYSHSREFRSNITAEWTFWSRVMETCGF